MLLKLEEGFTPLGGQFLILTVLPFANAGVRFIDADARQINAAVVIGVRGGLLSQAIRDFLEACWLAVTTGFCQRSTRRGDVVYKFNSGFQSVLVSMLFT